MDLSPRDFVTEMRRRCIQREAARIYLSREQFAHPSDLRAAVNDRYCLFGVVELSDEEFALLHTLVAGGGA